ncbi:cytosolic endo-beta-N-acetylglucosaminidase 1-like [Silene latifolia]|uniref:cytosolic endo-beta-N-acetylglucosaminidase 1-like n=1 Tax=Silene latifolia TaxID=37657 RepID=UPI003D770896
MLNFLRAHVKRQTLINFKNIIFSITTFFSQFLPSCSSMASKSQTHPEPEQFDPLKPSNPISYPIKTLEDLVSRSYFDSFHYPFNKSTVPLYPSSSSSYGHNDGISDGDDDGDGDVKWGLPNRGRILVCHDMAGGYGDDKWVQGGTNANAYAIWHWYLIDVFVYFSHSLVTLPPPCWVNAAHKHGTKVLGTFLTEWDEGKLVCDKLLSTKEYAQMCAERLTELAVALGFDGWLINMEVKLDQSQIGNLKEFVRHLTDTMHSSKPGSLVIWYDSVTIYGDLDWQDQLNDKNKAFFDSCDGIFTNYTWEEDYPRLSAKVAGDRKFDVYMGIDVFGRNTYGGGQWDTNKALEVIKKNAVSAAIFAPGWVYETHQPPDFQTAQNRWWSLVENSWGVMQNYPKAIPFYSDFDQGRGHHISVEGKQLFSADWCNLSCQGFQPLLEFSEDPDVHSIQASVDLRETSYSGGSNVTFKGVLGRNAHISKSLFQGKLLLDDSPLHFTYSVKSDGVSLVGLSLELRSTKGETTSALLASHGNALLTMNTFSSKFTKVIMPHQVTKLESSEGWVLQENAIAMPGYTLTDIRAVCYFLEPNVIPSDQIERDYYAVLGHLSIQTPGHNLKFPPSSSWLINTQSVLWEGTGQSKSVSLNISWSLKDHYDFNKIEKYVIYVEYIPEADGKQDYLGTAQVEAFYVSNLVVPSGTSSLKFFIQVCGVDGSRQPLDDSPSVQLSVEGMI